MIAVAMPGWWDTVVVGLWQNKALASVCVYISNKCGPVEVEEQFFFMNLP